MDAEDLGAFVAALHHVGHVGHGMGQNGFALGDGRGQKAGHTFGDDVLCPVAQAFGLCVVGVELIGTVAVDVHKAGDDALCAVVRVGGLFAVGEDAGDLAVFNFKCRRHELVGDPDFLALDDHGKCPPVKPSSYFCPCPPRGERQNKSCRQKSAHRKSIPFFVRIDQTFGNVFENSGHVNGKNRDLRRF